MKTAASWPAARAREACPRREYSQQCSKTAGGDVALRCNREILSLTGRLRSREIRCERTRVCPISGYVYVKALTAETSSCAAWTNGPG